eukprot:398027_1
MNIFQHLILILTHILYFNGNTFTSAQQKCSAMNSYIKLTSRITEGETLLSSQALFPPNTYYVPSSPIISLSSNENICNISEITTDITNKILLISTSDLCSDYYKTHIAKQKGAIAIMIGLDETVYPISASTDVFNATIPARGVDKWTLLRLQRMLEAENVYPQIEFGCDYKHIPLQLCIVDIEGDYWWMDGDYVRQINLTYNEHDVWKREGQYYTSDNNYIFLHNGDATNEWFWAITADNTFQDDTAIIAYCNNGNNTITLPTDCLVWNVRSRWRRRRPTSQYFPYDNLTVSNGSCVYPDNYMCVASTQSHLGGLSGTYRLFNKNVPFWYRETTQCDDTQGIIFLMRWSDNFNIFSSNIWWRVAECAELNRTIDYMMNPQRCKQWYTIMDNTLDRSERIIDNTFRITDSKCVNEIKCDASNKAVNSVCVYKKSDNKLPSMLEGIYVKTGYIESVEYVKSEGVNINGELHKPYLYYLGGFDEDMERWIFSNVSVSEYNVSTSLIYAHVQCSLMNVADCQAPWILYWNNSLKYADTLLHINEDDCPTETALTPVFGDEYEYLCVDIDDITTFIETFDTLYPYQLIGAYEMQRDGDFTYWRKPINDHTDDETYIYYDKLYGHWQISTSLTSMQTGIVCMSDSLYPDECNRWYASDACSAWTRGGGCMKTLDGMISFRTDTCSFNDILSKTCSAMHSWLQLSGDIEKTVASSHTLFAPYSYRIRKTEIVYLDSRDNPCDENSAITYTDISNKIVLTMSKTSIFLPIKCSDHKQLYVMEQNNATAVIIYSRDGTLTTIPDDDYFLDNTGKVTSIPMRGITYNKGEEIKDLLERGYTIYGEFNCNDSYKYPLSLCISNVGLEVYGNYELQLNRKDKNNHPIWRRNGYSIWGGYVTTYLYLHNGNGDNMWYWAITVDPAMDNDADKIAYCSQEQNITNLIIEPTQCTKWVIFDGLTETGIQWIDSDMKCNEGICNISDNYICISSEQSSLAGLSGVYRLYYDSEPVWFREWNDCDTHPGVFGYANGWFKLIDPMDGWIIAQCYIGDIYMDYYNKREYQNVFGFKPENCQEWYTVVDSSLDDELMIDDTFKIELKLDCSIECPEIDFFPTKLCLNKNSIMHSFLEGEYSETGVIGEEYGTKEYRRNEKLYYDGNVIDVYIWFYGELTEKYPWWIISSHNMSVGNAQNYSLVYGYNACKVSNPANCKGNWNFYWSGMNEFGSWHNDVEFYITVGDCIENENNTNSVIYGDEYEYICVDINTDLDPEYNETRAKKLKGGYKIRKDLTSDSDITGGTPFWEKPPNDYTKDKMYVYYDKFFGYWQIGSNLSIDAMLICHNSEILYPDKCNEWYDLYSRSLDDVLIFRVDSCSSNDMLSISDIHSEWGVAIAVIIVIIAVIGCCIGVYCLWNKLKHKRNYETFDDDNDNEENNNFKSNTNNDMDMDATSNYNQTEMGSTKTKKKDKKKKKKKKKKK